MQHTNKWITLLFLSFLCTAQALDTRTNPPAKKTPPPPPSPITKAPPAKKAPPAPPPPRPPAPEAVPTKPNRLQYHQHLMGTQTIGSTEYEHICEVGFANPTGLKVGDTLYITGRTDARTGTEESTTFFNRASGHKVLFVDDYKHNDDGNGGRVWIEGHPTTAEHRVGGTKNEHTFDGAYGSRK